MALSVLSVLVLVVRHGVLPNVDRYRGDIERSLERATGLDVTLGPITADWVGLRPRLRVDGLHVADREGREALAFRSAELSVSWWTLLAGDLRLHHADLAGASLSVRSDPSGAWFIAGVPLRAPGPDDDGTFARWLLAQHGITVRDASVTWLDEAQGVAPVSLSNAQLVVRKSGKRHRAALRAQPPADWGAPIDVRADVAIDHRDGRWQVAGTVFAQTARAEWAALRAHLPLPEAVQAGRGAMRLWADLIPGGVGAVAVDVSAQEVGLRLSPGAAPLSLAEAQGRVSWRALPDGWSVGVEKLALRTASGLATRVGLVSWSSSTPASGHRGELRADDVDLAALSALLPSVPMAPTMREALSTLAPRGVLRATRLAWEGNTPHEAQAWHVDSRFEALALAAAFGYPGFEGLTGTVSGNETKGRITVTSSNVTFDATRLFAAPLRASRLEAKAGWQRGAEGLEVAIDEARVSAPEFEASVAGRWRALPDSPERSPGWVDLSGRVERARATAAARFLPNSIAPARRWLESAILGGELSEGRFTLQGDLWHFPFQDASRGRFTAEATIANGRLRYDPAWPVVERIGGQLRFENASFAIEATEAQIYSSRARSAKAVIADLGARPPLLQLDVVADTAGGDGARFLRETPLVAGPGAFTKAIGVTGPARLQLRLDYPLWGKDLARVRGEYVFAGAQAAIGRSLVMQGIRGSLAFTERSVRATALNGTLFGQPAQLRLGMQGEGAVLAELDGRLGANVLGVFVPEAVSRRTVGTAAWRARIMASGSGTELRVTSSLEGLAVGLPEPFGKTASEARALSVTIRRLGEPEEETEAALGGDVHARVHRVAGRDGNERWQAAVRFGAPVGDAPRRDGLWLYGRLERLDLDAWRSAFAVAPAAAPGEPAPLELEGLSLDVSRLLYTGRELPQLSVRLRRDGTRWSGTLDGPPLSGEVSFDFTGRGQVRARLKHFALQAANAGASGPEPAPPLNDQPPPALDIVADRFEFRGRWLGRLALVARHDGPNWIIDRLDISNDHARFNASGITTRDRAGARTRLDLKVDAKDVSKLLGQFGYGAYLSRGDARLEGALDWPGEAYDFATDKLSGQLRVEAERGQFARIEAGAGKLLGLLSLQSLPRRITLDFRDVFSDGFAFDRVAGDVRVEQGVLRAQGFEIAGPSAFVTMTGEVSLPRETQSLAIRVVPEVGESVALAATVLGTPIMGLTTLLLQKLLQNPLGKAVAYDYRVTGSWDNPLVVRPADPSARDQAPRTAPRPAAP